MLEYQKQHINAVGHSTRVNLADGRKDVEVCSSVILQVICFTT